MTRLSTLPENIPQFLEIQLGNIKESLNRSEAHCLWEILPKRKFSAVSTMSTCKPETIHRNLKNISTKFNCSISDLIAYAIQANFSQQYHKAMKHQRTKSSVLFHD